MSWAETLGQLLIIGLGAFRLSWLLAEDDGPFDVFARMRALFWEYRGNAIFPRNQIGKLLLCPVWCLSVWTAGLAVLTWFTIPMTRWFWFWLAVAQVAAMVGVWVSRDGDG